MQIIVRDNNVDQALRALKKQLQWESVYRKMKLRPRYEKPSERRARDQAAAIGRAQDRAQNARNGIDERGTTTMTAIGTRIDEIGTLIRDGGVFYLRRDLGARYALELHRTPVDLVEKRVRLVGVLVGPNLVNSEGVAPA